MANTFSLDLESGSSQYAAKTDTASLSITGDISIECWVKLESLPGNGAAYGLINKGDIGTPSQGYRYTIQNDAGTYNLYAALNQTANDTTRDVFLYEIGDITGTWTHIAVTADLSEASATTFTFIINGSDEGNGSAVVAGNISSINDNADEMIVGATESSSSKQQFLDGLIDEVRIWNDVRTPTEVTNNYQKELTGGEAGLVAYYKLNNGYLDETSNSNDLTASGSPVFSSDVPFTGEAASLSYAYFM